MKKHWSGRTIIQRLDKIERERRATLCARYRKDYPELGDLEIERLGDLVVSTRIRVIAEAALARLPEGQVDEVLARFETTAGERSSREG